MTTDEYWLGDPHLLYLYEAAYINKRKMQEQEFWLMGLYVRAALQSSALNVNGFIQKKEQVMEYPECPHQNMGEKAKPLTPQQKALLEKARGQLRARGVLRES